MTQNGPAATADPDATAMTVSVTNVGGIDDCEVQISPGVTILSGRNATNRTSFLTAVAGVLGGNAASLKSDAEHGAVRLTIGEDTYTREYRRHGATVSVEGEPYSAEADVVNLFACLLRDNTARRAVDRGEDLREIIVTPIDREQLRRDIRDLESERDRIDQQLAEIERERKQLRHLEERKVDLEDELSAVTDELESLRAEIEAYDADEQEAEQAEALVSELDELRQERKRIETDIETQEAALAELRTERESARAELDELTVPGEKLDELEREIDRLNERRRTLGETINDLAAIVDLNEEVVSGSLDPLDGAAGGSDDVTAALDPSSATVECWTCGSQVERADLAAKLDELRELVETKRTERTEVGEQIETLAERRDELQDDLDRQSELERRLEEIDRKTDRREERIDALTDEREQVDAEVESLEARVNETEALRESDLVAKHERLSSLEYDRGQLEQKLGDVEDQIESLTNLADEREQLSTQREEIQDEIATLRSRVERLERSAVERFNTHMAEILDLLEYENIARVWVERKVGRDSRPDEASFELHVIRETADGTVYEDTVANLSESEREVIGLVVGLAGHLVHDVHEVVPLMLLDSMEAIDADRIAALVEYFAEFTPYLLIALLPEDEQALPDEYDRLPAEALCS
jgi:uncharacterized coiled-coil DUF342 family protein